MPLLTACNGPSLLLSRSPARLFWQSLLFWQRSGLTVAVDSHHARSSDEVLVQDLFLGLAALLTAENDQLLAVSGRPLELEDQVRVLAGGHSSCQLRHVAHRRSAKGLQDHVVQRVVAHIARMGQDLRQDHNLPALLRQGFSPVRVDKRPGRAPAMLVVALQLSPGVAQRHKDQAADYGEFWGSVVAVLTWHQPAIRLNRYVHLVIGAVTPDLHVHCGASGQMLRDEMQEVDALVLTKRNGRILTNLHTIDFQDHVVLLQQAGGGAQRPDLGHPNSTCEAIGQG
mmetsp:Transcript_101111/g.182485  ORF Transcript_101111/g.182485 Transcript_101111/m.182485 type:complete len:284 (+) Transcript_101111:132-983(+)